MLAGEPERVDRVIPLREKIVDGRFSLGGGEVLIGVELAEDLTHLRGGVLVEERGPDAPGSDVDASHPADVT